MEKTKSNIAQYKWTGLNRAGQVATGIIEAASLAIAKADLRKQGILPKKIAKKRSGFFDKTNKKIKQTDITFFTRQMATMLSAGIPLIQAFDIIGKGLVKQRMRLLVENIKKDVNTGTTFSEALRRHPAYFNELYCNLVDAGEKSGSLEMMLVKIATYKEKTEIIKKKIKKALMYPIAVIIIALLVTTALLLFVIPQFESMFKGFGADLPAMTRVVLTMSKFVQNYWYIILGLIGSVSYLFIQAKQRSRAFEQRVEKAMLQIPIIGRILKNAAIARFSRTLAITFAAGLPLVEALKSVSGATGNMLYAQATDQIREDISTGQQLQTAMHNTALFPQMVIQMVGIGEESGSLEAMLAKTADFYEAEVDNAVDSLSSLLEPIIMCILGVLVGGLVVAMYLPIFKLGSVL